MLSSEMCNSTILKLNDVTKERVIWLPGK